MIFKISTLLGIPLKFAEHLRILLVNISRLFTSLYHHLKHKKDKFISNIWKILMAAVMFPEVQSVEGDCL